MVTKGSVEIDAPARLVWEVFSDVERWPQWTASVTSLVALDGPDIAVGKRFAIKQPWLPRIVWKVTQLTPGASWTWVQRSPGSLTVACHDVIPTVGGRTLVRQEIDQQGLVGAVVGRLMFRTTKRYLDLEARGLKARTEQLRHLDGPAS